MEFSNRTFFARIIKLDQVSISMKSQICNKPKNHDILHMRFYGVDMKSFFEPHVLKNPFDGHDLDGK